jgi:hypothetical protein
MGSTSTYQERQLKELVSDLQGLIHEDWVGVDKAPGDLGTDGEGVVYFGVVGRVLRVRSVEREG